MSFAVRHVTGSCLTEALSEAECSGLRWLSVILQGGILLLTGPSGCGKTATVQVLSLELGLRVQEWTNPTNLEQYSNSQNGEGKSFLSYLLHACYCQTTDENIININENELLRLFQRGVGADVLFYFERCVPQCIHTVFLNG